MQSDAIVFDRGSGSFDRRPIALARPAGAAFLARVVSAGVCGTDLQVLRGERRVDTTVLGHEGVVRIVELLSPACPMSPGDLVVVNPTHPSRPDSVIGHSRDGLFSTYFYGLESDLEADGVLPFPSDLPSRLASLAEPIGVALLAHELTCSLLPRALCSALIVGAGSIGLCIAHVLSFSGVSVGIVDLSPTRIAYVDSLRLARVRATSAVPSKAQSFDAIFLCVPPSAAPDAWGAAEPLLAEDGVADFVCDIPGDGPYAALRDVRRTVHCGRRMGEGFVLRRTRTGTVFRATGHRGVSSRHIRQGLTLLARDPARWEPIVTHCVSPGSFCRAAAQHKATGLRTLDGREWVKMSITFEEAA